MADNKHKVTIDAGYFVELVKNGHHSKVEYGSTWQSYLSSLERKCSILESKLFSTSMERDELKAALERANQTNSEQADQLRDALNALENALEQERMNKCDEVTAKRLAAAERCIEEAFEAWEYEDGTDASYNRIGDILRAYRAVKAAR